MKISYSILVFLFLLLGTELLWAQKVTVKGKVTDENNVPVPYIRVIGNDGENGIETNDMGDYQFKLDRRDTLVIEFQSMDYENKIIKIPNPKEELVIQNVQLSVEGVTLGTVTVTEQFRQRSEETTVSLQAISSKRLDQMANTDIINAMSQVPGVTIYDDQPSIRGSSGYTYGAGSRVLTLLNGLPMLSADRGSVNFDMLPTDNISQVEVFKGASSVLYGAGAMGGVINVITADPADTPRTVIRMRCGIYDRPRNIDADWDNRSSSISPDLHFFHSRRIAEKLDLTAQVDLIKKTGYRKDEFSDRIRILLMPKYRFAKNFFVGCNTQLSLDSSANLIAWKDYPAGALVTGPGFLSYQVLYRVSIDPYLTYIGKKSQHLYQGRVFYQLNEINTGQSGSATLIYNEYQFKTGFWKDRIHLVAGANWVRNQVNAANTFGKAIGDQVAPYFQIKSHFAKRFNVVIGARFQYERVSGSDIVDTVINGVETKYRLPAKDTTTMASPIFRIGVNFRAGQATYIRASFGQALRSPSVAERYTSTFAGPIVVVPNPTIGVERGYSAEIGINQLFKFGGVKGFVDIAGFTMQFQNMVEFWADTKRLLAGQVAFKAQNISDASIYGAELTTSIEAQVTKNFAIFFNGGLTYIEPIDNHGSKAWDGDDSVSVIARNAISALAGSINSKDPIVNMLLKDVVPPSNPFPVDKPYTLKYRNKWLLRTSLELKYKNFSFTTNYTYTSKMVNVDKLFLIDLYEHSIPLKPVPPSTTPRELSFKELNDLGITLESLGLTRLFPNTRAFRKTNNTGWHIVDFILAYTIRKNTFSFHVFNALNSEYMTIPGTLGEQRNFAVQWKVTL